MSTLSIAGLWVAAVWVTFFTLNVVISEWSKPRAERSALLLWNAIGALGVIYALVTAAIYGGTHG